ncbi:MULTISPECIES: 2-oxoglutarate dehydrogenase E1 component [Paenibacillus]|uniref:2-oxoglutarate dehydrogenase E1 component n=1 Tax=Paenibacillus campinasensis TaxID=66347 RepID=A0ABW9T022_9BACL|nr:MULTISPECIES: 2-oxoglutarate dehydrogenase E1 component [Paenibacillus]MUG66623.1 2-oxoglutarate dehydrogenase E1 component [Paenibacillus campinasensis]PAK50480.1 2-oxoglutarate dehydrogenase E1 component [Paenibacillus sp. 7541]
MKTLDRMAEGPWQKYHGPNLGYIQDQYEKYLQNPDEVEPGYRELFASWGPPPFLENNEKKADSQGQVAPLDRNLLKKSVDAGKLVWNIRTYGHLAADIDPIGIGEEADTRLLQPETYQLSQADLAALPAEIVWENAPGDVKNGWEAVQRLLKLYTGTIAYEFSHIHDEEERNWLNHQVESGRFPVSLSAEERRDLLKKLLEAEQFEEFLHRTFVGAKRFSVEGNEALVPLLDEIVRELAEVDVDSILIGMAHRGRLNVLAHVLGKDYRKIFSEFMHSPNKHLVPSEGSMGINYGWTGDVKYHLGADRFLKKGEGHDVRITLANNPSHLEYVNPVVEGFARAAQEDRSQPGYPKQDVNKAASIQIHGDSAFPGEGVVAETLNFNKLPGYRTGGAIHIIVNNRIGFTTEGKDSRSTHYASDLAKGYEIPIIHVNADDPEACIAVARLASEYRNKFKKSILIDLVGYRKYGHNETDDPETTQPLIYQKVKTHPTVSTIYMKKLVNEQALSQEEVDQLKDQVVQVLKDAYDNVKSKELSDSALLELNASDGKSRPEPATNISAESLRGINRELLKWPEGFTVYPKLKRILERRSGALNEGEKVDWGHAETLAFATILSDGKPIRITGQDAERATFAHRNLVLHDSVNGSTFCPLHRLPQAKASFAIHNSPLTEEAVLGFEYGYNVYSPETLVIWEAQYGDFVNCAQVIIDQFISAGRSKWRQKSSLVMLLPHGYEGNGPEHSSARLERFLQLSGEDNWVVANLSSAAQYFHLLRRQAAITNTEDARPLVLMAPKSLIRNPRVASPVHAFSEGGFQKVLEQPGLGNNPKKVERLILCSGKVAIDLEDALDKQKDEDQSWLHILRVEQLYPFPKEEISRVLQKFPNLKEILWVQEEPQNMGSWFFMEPRIREIAPQGVEVRYNGRPERSSPASGYQDVHAYEQQTIISFALNRKTINQQISLGR